MIKQIKNKFEDIKQFLLLDKFIESKYNETFEDLKDGKYQLIFNIKKKDDVFFLSPNIQLITNDLSIKPIGNIESLFLMQTFLCNLKKYMRKQYVKRIIFNKGEHKR